MQPRPSIESLLTDLYGSVSDASRFTDFATGLRLAMDGHLVALQCDDRYHRHCVLKHYLEDDGFDPDTDLAVPEDDAGINLYFVRGARDFFRQGVINGSTLFERGELERTAFYRQTLVPIDVHWSMGFCLSEESSGELVALTVSRDRHRPDFEPEVLAFAGRLLPHLRNVYDMRQRLGVLENIARGLDCVGLAVWLVDGEGLVLHANNEADGISESILSGLHCHGRQLLPVWPPDRPMLKAALAGAARMQSAQRAELLLHDAAGQAWATCRIQPLHHTTFADWSISAVPAAVVMVQPLECAVASPDPLRRVFGLTPAEARLATALLRYGSLSECVNKLGSQRETLRTHLKGLFAKTETHRQADLIRRLGAAVH